MIPDQATLTDTETFAQPDPAQSTVGTCPCCGQPVSPEMMAGKTMTVGMGPGGELTLTPVAAAPDMEPELTEEAGAEYPPTAGMGDKARIRGMM